METLKSRPSTFHYWIHEESGPVKHIAVEEFMKDNPEYTSDYMNVYNLVRSSGCKYVKGIWTDPNGKKYENIYECHDRYAVLKFQ